MKLSTRDALDLSGTGGERNPIPFLLLAPIRGIRGGGVRLKIPVARGKRRFKRQLLYQIVVQGPIDESGMAAAPLPSRVF